ncbi:DUF2180 family protein [Streptomyces armeniacus]|uniref:DUF2180 family protein n=1 Tax=Streptomyces armeniacus TaxID=83291 RepID=A0A345XXE1_9ACTN|nr:DUF2180 family protein [Streptomyces armeniacus]AXK36307.1 DUF2180 family protein [Streptomyces armeniacus]
MNCFDCPPDRERTAVAVCHRCGAGLCRDHAHTGVETVHAVHGTGRATHTPSARRLSCGTCREAES